MGVLTRVRLHSGEGGTGTGWIVLTVLGVLVVGFIVFMVIKAHRTNKREGFPNQPKPNFPPPPQPAPPPQLPQQPYPPQPGPPPHTGRTWAGGS
jgi:hypothetical protein